MKKFTTLIVFVISVLLFITMIGMHEYLEYTNQKARMYQTIDAKLKAAALSSISVMDEAFLEKGIHHEPVDDSIYWQSLLDLSTLAKRNDVEYIYIMKKEHGKIHFITSSATDEEIKTKTKLVSYFDEYDDAPKDIEKAFNTGKTTFAEYSDKWGTFRSIFIPITTNNNELYVVAADIKISEINTILSKAAWDRGWRVSLIILIGFALFFWQLLFFNRRLSQQNTSLVETQQKLIEAKEIAESATKAKDEFLANMSHEIRTPMNGLLGFVEHLEKGEKDPERLKQFAVIRKSGQTLLSIINDILDFSKIENGKMELEFHPQEMHLLFKDASSIFTELFRQKKIHFEEHISEILPQCLMVDSVRLKQVIINLLNNAIKFTPEGGKITLDVQYKVESRELQCAVIDTGIGIAKENLEKIFDAFGQEDSSTTRKFGGTGLGLSISSNLIKMMKGELKVESKLGEGSRFYFTIPINECSKNDIQEVKTSHPPIPDNVLFNGHVLVVEDNQINQMLMEIILESKNVTFEIANDGIEALSLFERNYYDAIFMDQNMPNMNGIEATERIRTIESEQSRIKTPIIAVTANAMSEDRQRFLDIGFNDYISKPYSEIEIVNVLRNFLPIIDVESDAEEKNSRQTVQELSTKNEGHILNFDRMKELVPIPETELVKMLCIFQDSIDGSLERLRIAIELNDLDAIEFEAHRLSGTTGNLRIDQIQILLKEMEIKTKQGEAMDYKEALLTLEKIVQKLKKEIATLVTSSE